MPLSKRDWTLTSDALDGLLAFLDSDRERAGEKYERTRQMLMIFFQSRGLNDGDELADETINRVARRLSEGEHIEASPGTYFYAVARNVWREQVSRPQVLVPGDNGQSHLVIDAGEEYARAVERNRREQRFDCLEKCLAELPADERDAILSYYQGEKALKIKARKEMAARLGIQTNSLRVRMSRVRERLERCVRNCPQVRTEKT